MQIKLQVKTEIDLKDSGDIDTFAFVCALESSKVFLERHSYHLIQRDLTCWQTNDGTTYVFLPDSADFLLEPQWVKVIDGSWLGEKGTWYCQ